MHPASDPGVPRPLSGRTALVTGSTAGIGLDTAHALAAQGADLMLNGFGEPAAIEALCRSLTQDHGVRVAHHGADVSQPAQLQALVAAAQDHGRGRLDILVNNAGYSVDCRVEDFDPQVWEHQLALNLSAPFHAIRHVLPGMRQHGWGRIVNVASVMGLVGLAQRAGYVATKHALVGLTKVVALETADSAITCNAVCPGLVGNERVREGHRRSAEQAQRPLDEFVRSQLSIRQPSGRYIPPEDVAATIAFLCGPHASEIRGVAWTVDGGWSAR